MLNWEDLAARALAIQPPYRPIPGTAVYHLCVDGHIIQIGEYDLEGPLRDLAVVVLAIGSKMLGRRPRDRLVVHTVPEPEFARPSGVTVGDQRAVMGAHIAAALVGAGLRADQDSDRADLEVLRCAHRLEIAGLRTSRPGRAASSTAHTG